MHNLAGARAHAAQGPMTVVTGPCLCRSAHPRPIAARASGGAPVGGVYCLMICPRISPAGKLEVCTFVYALPLLSSTFSESPEMVFAPLATGFVRSIEPVETRPFWIA